MKKALLAAFLLLSVTAHAAATPADDIGPWAQETMRRLFTFDARTFESVKKANRPLFTAEGYQSFYKAMDRARLHESLRINRQSMAVDKICISGITPPDGKTPFWKVEGIAVMAYRGDEKARTDSHKVTLLVESKDGGDAPAWAIGQYIAVPAGEQEAAACGGTDPRAARREEIQLQIRQLEDELRRLDDASRAQNEADSLR